MNPAIVSEARRIRERLPHVTLSEALRYADPSTVQGRLFQRSRRGVLAQGYGGFFGSEFSRFAIVEAHAWHATLWGPNRSNRVWRYFRQGLGASLESAEWDTKQAYGNIVMREEGTIVAFERMHRRCVYRDGTPKPGREWFPQWPGTFNMPRGDANAWCASLGLSEAINAWKGC